MTPSLPSQKNEKHQVKVLRNKSQTAKAAPIDDHIKKQFQLPASSFSDHDNDVHVVPSQHSSQVNPMSRILENSNTNEVGDLNYVVIGNLKIAAILKFPLAAYHTIQHLVKQLNLLISDQTSELFQKLSSSPSSVF